MKIFAASNLAVQVGRAIQEKDILNKEKWPLLVGSRRRTFFHGIDPLGKKIIVANVSFEVVGITEKEGTGGFISGNIDRVIYVLLLIVQEFDGKRRLASNFS